MCVLLRDRARGFNMLGKSSTLEKHPSPCSVWRAMRVILCKNGFISDLWFKVILITIIRVTCLTNLEKVGQGYTN